MTPAKDGVVVPKTVLYGLVASLILLIAGALVTVFAGLPSAVADNRRASAVNAATIASIEKQLDSLHKQTDLNGQMLREIAAKLRK